MFTLRTQEKSIRGNICTEVGVPRKWNKCCISGFPVSRAGRIFHKSTQIVVTCNQQEIIMDDIDIFGNSHFVKTSTEEMTDHALRRLISPTNATNSSRTTSPIFKYSIQDMTIWICVIYTISILCNLHNLCTYSNSHNLCNLHNLRNSQKNAFSDARFPTPEGGTILGRLRLKQLEGGKILGFLRLNSSKVAAKLTPWSFMTYFGED